MKKYLDPTIEIVEIEILDILTQSAGDEVFWNLYGESGWITD